MTLIIDAAPLVALADALDPMSRRVEEVLKAEQGMLIVPAAVSAEADYLLGRRVGREACRRLLADLAVGRFLVPTLELGEYAAAAELDPRYSDLDVGLADLSIAMLARRFETRRLLTFDERHFRALAPLQGGWFELLPADA